ncbi:MAG: hypothetical protein NTY55_02795 [Flavobacteriia bacterium]|nr:hypothetical protein [Flavobacteriia bacterium]
MKNLLLIILLCLSVDVVGQTVYKNRKQELRIERVIENSVGTYKVYFHASYLVVGNKAMMDLFVEELLGTISTGKTVNTYVGNTAVRYVPFEDEVEVFARTSSFKLSKKQIVKLKSKLL